MGVGTAFDNLSTTVSATDFTFVYINGGGRQAGHDRPHSPVRTRGSTKAGHTSQIHRRTRASLEECKAGTPARLAGCRGRAMQGGNFDFGDPILDTPQHQHTKTHTTATGLGWWAKFLKLLYSHSFTAASILLLSLPA